MTSEQIEHIAVKIAEPDCNWRALVADLSDADLDAVLTRAEEISGKMAASAQAEAEELAELTRLARAAGCPAGIPVIPWLEERGLIGRRASPSEVEHD